MLFIRLFFGFRNWKRLVVGRVYVLMCCGVSLYLFVNVGGCLMG